MSDHEQPITGNVLDRQFAAERPNQPWVGDTTEFVIGRSAKLYLAAIMDLHSRFTVGLALSAVNSRPLTLSALERAIKRRCPEAGLLHHSDQGCTYASEDLLLDRNADVGAPHHERLVIGRRRKSWGPRVPTRWPDVLRPAGPVRATPRFRLFVRSQSGRRR